MAIDHESPRSGIDLKLIGMPCQQVRMSISDKIKKDMEEILLFIPLEAWCMSQMM